MAATETNADFIANGRRTASKKGRGGGGELACESLCGKLRSKEGAS